MLEYDPLKHITASQALEHEYFRVEPLPGRNAFVASQPMEKNVNYPTRPVDTNTDFEGTTRINLPQAVAAGNMAGGHGMGSRSMPRPMVAHNMQRMQPQGGVMAYNFPVRV
ncbi:Cyclin-dependent kinase E-1 [Raphanus sativus]|nr:Cyclin-dependent kinase E-1 [Raphanus sativus]